MHFSGQMLTSDLMKDGGNFEGKSRNQQKWDALHSVIAIDYKQT